MKFISYSHNLEDVILQRAFAGIDNGFYIDVGAAWPCETSNTWALYQKGWSGIAIDPLFALLPKYEETWSKKRPRDMFVKSAIGDREGELTFYPCTNLQFSTGSPQIISQWKETGSAVVHGDGTQVRLTRLGLVVPPGQEVHLLSIDVEGMEANVIAGTDFDQIRPWVIVIESVHGTDWEPKILSAGYTMVHEDGSGRFYLANDHADLSQWFRYPPHSLEYVTWRELKLEQRVHELEAELRNFFWQ